MTGFSAEWLSLRAPADDAARDASLIADLATWARERDAPVTVADYGGGSGAGLRALSPHLPDDQCWRILDDDADLLARIPAAKGIETVQADLAAHPERGLSPHVDIVTGFAFFDLVSAGWIDRFARLVADTGAALYGPLTYDGVETWAPTPPHEARALAAFNADMRRDKGFGPALGAEAAPYLANAMKREGYSVTTASSPWRLARPRDAALMDALATGGAAALAKTMSLDDLDQWAQGRRRATEASIGHIDLLALPPA